MIAIDDVVLTINALLGDMADDFVFAAADMNGDNRIMIDDVVIINHLLGVNTANVMSTNDVACESLGISETQNGFGMNLSNATNYTAMQFDMTIPEGVSINDIRVTSGTDHSVAFRENGNGQVVASLSNELFTSANLLDVAVTAESVANIHITNVYVATPDGVKVKVSDAEVNLTTTGIQQVGVEIAPHPLLRPDRSPTERSAHTPGYLHLEWKEGGDKVMKPHSISPKGKEQSCK